MTTMLTKRMSWVSKRTLSSTCWRRMMTVGGRESWTESRASFLETTLNLASKREWCLVFSPVSSRFHKIVMYALSTFYVLQGLVFFLSEVQSAKWSLISVNEFICYWIIMYWMLHSLLKLPFTYNCILFILSPCWLIIGLLFLRKSGWIIFIYHSIIGALFIILQV